MFYIYTIKNIINNKNYIGSTNNIKRRINEHFNNLKKGNHNYKLLNDYKLYGKNNFIYEILEEYSGENEEELQEIENYWISKLDSINNGYNIKTANKNSFKKNKKFHGTKNHKVKLKTNDYIKIKEELIKNDGLALKDKIKKLMKEYKISDKTIYKIHDGTHWSCK